MSNRDAQIVVVGAGAAGLSAAHHLIQNGFTNVVILEATDRIGGRIHTIPFGEDGGIIEMGANWIHGVGPENSMYTLAESKGQEMEPFIFLDKKKLGRWLMENGEPIDKKVVDKAFSIFEEIEEELEEGIPRSKKKLSFKDYIFTRIEEKTKRLPETEKSKLSLAFKFIVNVYGSHIGDDPSLASASLYASGGNVSEDDVLLLNGFSSLLQTLCDEMPDIVKFERRVESIDWNCEENNSAKILCNFEEDSEEHIADHVIVTCSLGYLKQQHLSLFSPNLPERKADAIEKMGFGKVGKIFLYYYEPFWKKGEGNFKLAWENPDDALTDSQYWYKSICQFMEIMTCPNVLLGFVNGSATEHMESLSESEIMSTCTDILRKFLQDDSIPEPASAKTSAWCTDPLFLGAYSYYSIDSHETCVADIAEPLLVDDDKPVVCFAGEATHDAYFSYAHGARSSGIREAQRIIDYYS